MSAYVAKSKKNFAPKAPGKRPPQSASPQSSVRGSVDPARSSATPQSRLPTPSEPRKERSPAPGATGQTITNPADISVQAALVNKEAHGGNDRLPNGAVQISVPNSRHPFKRQTPTITVQSADGKTTNATALAAVPDRLAANSIDAMRSTESPAGQPSTSQSVEPQASLQHVGPSASTGKGQEENAQEEAEDLRPSKRRKTATAKTATPVPPQKPRAKGKDKAKSKTTAVDSTQPTPQPTGDDKIVTTIENQREKPDVPTRSAHQVSIETAAAAIVADATAPSGKLKRKRKPKDPNAALRGRRKDHEDAEAHEIDPASMTMAELTKDRRRGRKSAREKRLEERDAAEFERKQEEARKELAEFMGKEGTRTAPPAEDGEAAGTVVEGEDNVGAEAQRGDELGRGGAASAAAAAAAAAASKPCPDKRKRLISPPDLSPPLTANLGPTFRIDQNGQIVTDDSARQIDRQALAAADYAAHPLIEHEEDILSRRVNSASHGKRGRGVRWTVEMTELFFEGLGIFGTDFAMVATLFGTDAKGKEQLSRRTIKLKFVKEEKVDDQRVTEALAGRGRMLGRGRSRRATTIRSEATGDGEGREVDNEAGTRQESEDGDGEGRTRRPTMDVEEVEKLSGLKLADPALIAREMKEEEDEMRREAQQQADARVEEAMNRRAEDGVVTNATGMEAPEPNIAPDLGPQVEEYEEALVAGADGETVVPSVEVDQSANLAAPATAAAVAKTTKKKGGRPKGGAGAKRAAKAKASRAPAEGGAP